MKYTIIILSFLLCTIEVIGKDSYKFDNIIYKFCYTVQYQNIGGYYFCRTKEASYPQEVTIKVICPDGSYSLESEITFTIAGRDTSMWVIDEIKLPSRSDISFLIRGIVSDFSGTISSEVDEVTIVVEKDLSLLINKVYSKRKLTQKELSEIGDDLRFKREPRLKKEGIIIVMVEM